MKAGKLSDSALRRSVFRQLNHTWEDVLPLPDVGVDGSRIPWKHDEDVVLSMDPVTLSRERIGWLGICAALNDVACAGATPVAVLVSILLPTSASEQLLRDIMGDMRLACDSHGIAMIGGHTEVTRAVREPLVTVTGVGRVHKSRRMDAKSIVPDMDIVATKWIGLEGTAILASEKYEALAGRFAKAFLEQAKAFYRYIPIWPEAAVAVESGAGAMHDVSEGGIYGALWDMAERAGVGLEIDLQRIPIRQETVEICEFFDLNPYKLLGGGCALIAAEDGESLVQAMERDNIPAVVIGRTTDSNDRILFRGEERRFLETTQRDELRKIFE